LVPSKNPEKLAKQIIAGGLSVRAAEALIKKEHQAENGGSEKRTARPTGEKDADTRALEGDLSANLGLKVTLNHKPGQEAGQMVLHYTTMDELDELCQRLSAS
jgi:ParB family chromosome partitioning protein